MANRFSGTIIKKSGENTISVLVNRKINAPKYGKQITRSKKYLVHDPDNICKIGDKINFISSKPISRSKKYIVIGN